MKHKTKRVTATTHLITATTRADETPRDNFNSNAKQTTATTHADDSHEDLKSGRNSDDPTISRSKKDPVVSTLQTQQPNEDHSTKRVAATTHVTATTTRADDNRRTNSDGKQATAMTHAEDSYEGVNSGHNDDDDPTTGRSEGRHFFSILETHQSTGNHTTRRTAATTPHDNQGHLLRRRPPYQRLRPTPTTHVYDAMLARYHIRTQSIRHNERQHTDEKKTPTSRTPRPKRTTRWPTTTTAPRRAPKAIFCHGSEVKEEEDGEYSTARGDVPLSSKTQPQPRREYMTFDPTRKTATRPTHRN